MSVGTASSGALAGVALITRRPLDGSSLAGIGTAVRPASDPSQPGLPSRTG